MQPLTANVSYAHDKYNQNIQPDQHTVCDLSTCDKESLNNAVRLGCFHTCHVTCLRDNENQCQLCKVPLAMKVKELTDSFNSSLLDPESVVPPSTINNDNQSDDEEDETITVPSNKDYNYYQSTEWKEFVETELLDINITQPQIPHIPCQKPTEFTPLKQRRCTFCKEHGHNRSKCRLLKFDRSRLASQRPTQSQDKIPIPSGTSASVPHIGGLRINPTTMGSFTIWNFPFCVSQSTINGRMGSNACTLISLLLAKAYLMNEATLQLDKDQPLSGQWNTVIVSCILGRNSVYDSCISHGRFLSVLEAVPFVACSIGEVSLNEELTVCFAREDHASQESALSSQITSYFEFNDHAAALVIVNGKTITFVKQENAIILLDTHANFEHNNGAMVAMVPKETLEDLLLWIKTRISPVINLCTVTFAKYLP